MRRQSAVIKHIVRFALLAAVVVVVPLVAVTATLIFGHDFQVAVHAICGGPSKAEARQFGDEMVAAIHRHKELRGHLPKRLEDVEHLPESTNFDVDYLAGGSNDLFVLRVVAGPHRWAYYEDFHAWDYLPDQKSD